MQEGEEAAGEIIDYMNFGALAALSPPTRRWPRGVAAVERPPLATIVAGGWIIVARTHAPRRVAASNGTSARAYHSGGGTARSGGVRLRAGVVMALMRGRHRLLTDRRLSAGEGLAARHGSTNAGTAGAGRWTRRRGR